MNRNHCNNCGDKVPKLKRRDAIYCDHPCRMVVANARNHGLNYVVKTIAAAVSPATLPMVNADDVREAWRDWTPPPNCPQNKVSLREKPAIRSEDILAILEELHR